MLSIETHAYPEFWSDEYADNIKDMVGDDTINPRSIDYLYDANSYGLGVPLSTDADGMRFETEEEAIKFLNSKKLNDQISGLGFLSGFHFDKQINRIGDTGWKYLSEQVGADYEEYAKGGELELETWREDGVSENEKMDYNKLTRSEVKDILKELGYNVTEDNFSKFHKKEHFDYIKEKDVFYRNDINDKYAGGGEAKKRRRSASIQYGRSDRAFDKQLTAKPVGYRFTNAKANQLRKDPYDKPTEAQVKKYLGKGIYKENRKNRSDKDRNAKL